MKRKFKIFHNESGFTLIEIFVAIGMMSIVIMTLSSILLNPQKKLDDAIRRSSSRQALNIAIEKLSDNLERSFPMRYDYITCENKSDLKSMSSGYATVGVYSDLINSEKETDYRVLSITDIGDSVQYYYANYDGIAAKSQDETNTFRVVEADRFSPNDILLISPVHRPDMAALVRVSEKQVLGDGSVAALKLESGVVLDAAFACTPNNTKLSTLKEVVESIPYHNSQAKSYIPHTFRVRNINFEKFVIEKAKNRQHLYSYRWPFSSKIVKRTIMAQDIVNFQIWERWLPTANDPLLESGQFVGRLVVEHKKFERYEGSETIKLNTTYTINKGLRSNYDVVTSVPNPTFNEPEGSLSYSLIDDAKECDFGWKSWDLDYLFERLNKYCQKGQEFFQYIKFTVTTQTENPNITLNLPRGLVCWNADNVIMTKGDEDENENIGLTFNSRRSMSSSEVTLYDRNGYNLYCKVKPETSAQILKVKGQISAFVDAYNRDVTKNLNTIEVEVPGFDYGFKDLPTCNSGTFEIFTGNLNSLKPTYTGIVQHEDNINLKVYGCEWEKEGVPGSLTWDDCTFSKTGFNPGDNWKLRKVKVFPRNLIDPTEEVKCVQCDSGTLGDCS